MYLHQPQQYLQIKVPHQLHQHQWHKPSDESDPFCHPENKGKPII